MAGWNGSGTFSRTYNWSQDQANGIKIVASRHDANDVDFVNGINNCLTKDGQNSPSAALPMATYNHTNVGKATALNQYATAEQVIDNELKYYTATGTDTYVITPNPAITSYAEGQSFYVNFANGNTGAATINVNSLGAKALTKEVSTALASGDLVAGKIYEIVYDGTRFQVQLNGVSSASNIADNAIVRGDGGGKSVQGSGVTIDDSNNITGVATLGVTGLITAPVGITFGDDTLEDYDPGTWTPEFTFESAGDVSVSYATQSGTYTRIGDTVTVRCQLTCTPTFSTSSGDIYITGLPFSAALSQAGCIAGGNNANYPAFGTSRTQITVELFNNQTRLRFGGVGNGVMHTFIEATQVTSGVALGFIINITYKVN